MKDFQINIRTNNKLEKLKVLAKTKEDAIDLAYHYYSGYVKMGFIKEFKILSVIEIGEEK